MYQNLPNNSINPYYNPYTTNQYGMNQYQQRMIQQPTEVPQPAPTAATVNNYLKGWPVTSLEEARAARIDLDGSPFLFTDYGHNKIYMKQINMDGTAALRTFTLVEDSSAVTQPDYVTHEQLEAALTEFRNSFLGTNQRQQAPAATEARLPQNVKF